MDEQDDLIKNIKHKLSSRKLHVAVIGFISATIFFCLGMLPPDLWVELVKWLFGLYAIGNVGEHLANGMKNRTTR